MKKNFYSLLLVMSLLFLLLGCGKKKVVEWTDTKTTNKQNFVKIQVKTNLPNGTRVNSNLKIDGVEEGIINKLFKSKTDPVKDNQVTIFVKPTEISQIKHLPKGKYTLDLEINEFSQPESVMKFLGENFKKIDEQSLVNDTFGKKIKHTISFEINKGVPINIEVNKNRERFNNYWDIRKNKILEIEQFYSKNPSLVDIGQYNRELEKWSNLLSKSFDQLSNEYGSSNVLSYYGFDKNIDIFMYSVNYYNKKDKNWKKEIRSEIFKEEF